MRNRSHKYQGSFLGSLFQSYEQPVRATIQLLSGLGISVPHEEINDRILSHPDYPSLLAISDCLREWKLENVAAKVQKGDLADYPFPMMVNTDEGFKVLTGFENDKVYFVDENGQIRFKEKEVFFYEWSGVALMIEEDSLETARKNAVSLKKTKSSTLPLLVSAILLLTFGAIGLFSPSHGIAWDISYSALLILKLTGIFISALLLWYMADKNNVAMRKLCGAGEKTDCHAILSSPQANVFKGLSWSEVGTFYFTGTFLTLVLFPELISTVAWMNVLALPFTVFSLSYQYFVAKKWCTLCLSVQALLSLEALTSLLGGLHGSLLSPGNVGLNIYHVLVCMLLPVAGWFTVKPFVLEHYKNKKLKYEFARLKQNPSVIAAVLQQQKRLESVPDGMGIELGNRRAKNSIVTVSNPYCPPCAKTHLELDELLDNNKVKAQLLFTASPEPTDKKAAPVEHLLAIASEGDEKVTRQALDDWYESEKKDYSEFAEKYKRNGEIKMQAPRLRSMAEWCKTEKIQHTPTIYVNGRELPPQFNLRDLKYMFEEE